MFSDVVDVCWRRKRECGISKGKFQEAATLWSNVMVFHRLGIKMYLSASSYHKTTLMPQLTQQSSPQVLWVNFVVLCPGLTQSISHQAGPLQHNIGETLSQVSALWRGDSSSYSSWLFFASFYFCSYRCKPKVTLWSPSSLLPPECWYSHGSKMWLLGNHNRI